MNMIEKVARAMHYSIGIMLPYDALSETSKRHLFIQAKAGIKAMREPTDEMLKAFYGDVPIDQWLKKDWYDMIDAALKE